MSPVPVSHFDYLVHHLTANESAIVLGTAMRYDLAQLVDPQVNVVAKVSKAVLSQLSK